MGLYLWLIISMLTPFLLKKQVVLNWKAGSDKIRIHCKQVFFLLGVWCESLQEMHLFTRVRQRERTRPEALECVPSTENLFSFHISFGGKVLCRMRLVIVSGSPSPGGVSVRSKEPEFKPTAATLSVQLWTSS